MQALSGAEQPSSAHQSGIETDPAYSVRPPLQGAEGPQVSTPPQRVSSSRELDTGDDSMQSPAEQMQHAATGSRSQQQQQQQQQQADSTSFQGPLLPSRGAHPSGAKNASAFKLDMSKLHKHPPGQQPGSALEAPRSASASTSLPASSASGSKGHEGGAPVAISSQVSCGEDAAEGAGLGQQSATSDQVHLVPFSPPAFVTRLRVLQLKLFCLTEMVGKLPPVHA